jgi:hypothetical protein
MMTLKLIFIAVILMAFVVMALGIKLLFNRNSRVAINSCCSANHGSTCVCSGKTDNLRK